MPFISDDELLDFQVQIDNANEQKRVTNYVHTKAIRDEQEKTKKFKISTILVGIIALLGIAGIFYFMNKTPKDMMISKTEYDKHVNLLENKITSLKETVQNTQAASQKDTINANIIEGSLRDELVYAIQIGAFEEKNLSLYSDSFVNFKEIKKGVYNKYALGNFSSLDEAKQFRKELVRLGFNNAFIASYQNGKRLRIEEAF